jgi:hypothetical protein
MKGFKLDAAEVAALGQVSGGHLTRLTIAAAELHTSFWSSVLLHLPKLDTRVLAEPFPLGPGVMADISMFYCRAPRPITLMVDTKVLPDREFEELQERCQLWDPSQVTISRPSIADQRDV